MSCIIRPPKLSAKYQSPEDFLIALMPKLEKNERKFIKGILKQYEVYKVYKDAPVLYRGIEIRENFLTIDYFLRTKFGKIWFEHKIKNYKK